MECTLFLYYTILHNSKSTVLHAIAGRIKDSGKIDLYGKRYVNGLELAGDSLVPSAFIEQDVNFFPHMTVHETLDFRVQLKLGNRLSKHGREQLVADLLKQVGLTKVKDTLVGNTKVRGISGGERKRLSIAVEMISSPTAIFLDEPTRYVPARELVACERILCLNCSSFVFLTNDNSGLDATAATRVVQTLRRLADDGKTVVAVIHQPSQHVFAAVSFRCSRQCKYIPNHSLLVLTLYSIICMSNTIV